MRETLNEWLEKNLSLDQKNLVTALLRVRGYSVNDLNTSIEKLISFSPRLLLNSFYETLLELKFTENDVLDLLKPLEQYAIAQENSSTDALAHFIWVGPPTPNGRELLGIKSLQDKKPGQPIRLWVLDEYVNDYQDIFRENKNVMIVSIENYVKKMNISFDVDGKDLLDKAIEKYKIYANDKEAIEKFITDYKIKDEVRQNTLRKKLPIRHRVTIVDYIKTLIPLYEGGWVFDADILFLKKTTLDHFQKQENWFFPKINKGADVWLFYCNKSLGWDINKKNAGAFIENKKGEKPGLQMYLMMYHMAVLRCENILLGKVTNAHVYGMGVVLMTHWLDRESLSNFFASTDTDKYRPKGISSINSWYYKTSNKIEYAYTIPGRILKKEERHFEIFRTYSWHFLDCKNFSIAKYMNKSHRLDVPDKPRELSCLAISDKESFREVASLLMKYGCCDLWTPVTCTIPYALKEKDEYVDVAIEKLSPYHLSLFLRLDSVSIMNDIISKEILHRFCVEKVNIPNTLLSETDNVPGTTAYALTNFFPEGGESLKEMLDMLGKNLSDLCLLERDFSDFDFRGVNLSRVEFNWCKLNNILIDADTNLTGIVCQANVPYNVVRYQLADQDNPVEIKMSDLSLFLKSNSRPGFFSSFGANETDLLYLLSRISKEDLDLIARGISQNKAAAAASS